MTPILNPTTDEQRYFNKIHAKARSKVERCIGVLKSRFRCLLGERKLLYSHEKASHIIVSCVILHNFLRKNFDDADNAVDVRNGNLIDRAERNQYGTAGNVLRNRLAHQLYENQNQSTINV